MTEITIKTAMKYQGYVLAAIDYSNDDFHVGEKYVNLKYNWEIELTRISISKVIGQDLFFVTFNIIKGPEDIKQLLDKTFLKQTS